MNADSPEIAEIRMLFQSRVHAIASGVVMIRGIVREPGNRTILAVTSKDSAADAVGSCVGLRGAVIKDIVAELHGELIDIVLWKESAKEFLSNLLAPARFRSVSFDEASHQAIAVLDADWEPVAAK